MCGFLGIYGPSAPVLGQNLPAGLRTLLHRGPDAQGEYQAPNQGCVLGHVRLAIVDTSNLANQPLHRAHGVLVYNGETYNHQLLRQHNDNYTSHSDTETLLVGLMQQGAAFLNQAEGMFAGAFYDEQADTLLLFRDDLGIKPLYYTILPDSSVAFASEIKGLLTLLPSLERRCNLAALSLYMAYENYPQGTTLLEGIHLLPPGETLLLSRQSSGSVMLQPGRLQREEAPPLPQGLSRQALIDSTRTHLEQAVTAHLMSDVPLGVYLSGGIDSSLVATLASRDVKDLAGFTGYFETKDAYYDERPLARDVAQAANIDLMEVPITPTHFMETLDPLIYTLDEPRMGMGAFSQYVVAHQAAQHRKVILAGHGGDELFGGYPLFKAFWLLEMGLLSRQSLGSLKMVKPKEWPWILDLAKESLTTGRVRFAPELYPAPLQHIQAEALRKAFVQSKTSALLEQLNRYYVETYLPGLLMVEDKISMAHSLETRVPLWSQALIGWVSQIPLREKIPGGQLKGLLREIVQPILPQSLLSAPKRGFPTPLRLWLRNELREFTYERLVASDTLVHQIVSKKAIASLLKSHQQIPMPFPLDERRAHRIWILLCLESWFRQYQVTLKEPA
jgi:asparagine synthase (glutamine-hydrolysing)